MRVNDGGQGPGAEDLGGPYEVIVSAFKPWAHETDVNSLKGDATGAIAVESSSGPRGQAHRSEYRVSADEALSFFTSLNPLTWWTLGDETGAARDGTTIEQPRSVRSSPTIRPSTGFLRIDSERR